MSKRLASMSPPLKVIPKIVINSLRHSNILARFRAFFFTLILIARQCCSTYSSSERRPSFTVISLDEVYSSRNKFAIQ